MYTEDHYIAKTLMGLEPVLEQELLDLGAKNIKVLTRAVRFEGDLELLYKANLCLRTALKILVPIKRFKAREENVLYHKIKSINWANFMDLEDTFKIDCVANSIHFTHSQYAALKSKDAIVDQFREKFEKRPSIDIENPNLRINIHIWQDEISVSLDSSGHSLHKRGYREGGAAAPLNECLAAGMILLSGWNKDCNFIDPMCGSGTLLSEAALIATNTPPLFLRKQFGFQQWKNYDEKILEKVKEEALAKRVPFKHKIYGSDVNDHAIEQSRINIKHTGLQELIKLSVCDFEDLVPPAEAGIIVCNPPYGERLDEEDIGDLYGFMGDQLKQVWKGYDAWLISSNKQALKCVGLRPSRKFTLANGPLECKFHKYSMYAGSKKQKYQEKGTDK